MWPSIFSTLFWGCYIWTGISFSWVHAAPATQLPSPWYLQELQTSSIASSTTDILATTSNGTHIFVMTADDFLHLYSYSETGEPNATLGFIGSFNISRSVQDELATGLNWRTSSAFALQYNEHTKELYAIKYVAYVLRSLAIYILDPYTYSVVGSLIYGEVDTYEGYWNSNARNPRLATYLDSLYLYVGIFNDPSITNATGRVGFWMSRSTHRSGALSRSIRKFNTTQIILSVDFQCNSDNSIICLWTSQNSVDEYSMATFNYVRTRTISSTLMKFNPSIAKNASDKTSYFFHRSVDVLGNPFVLHRRNETYQQMSSDVLPYQISFSDAIPEFGVKVGSDSNVIVGFTSILNESIGFRDIDIVICQYTSSAKTPQGQLILSTIGKDNFAAVIPQNNNSFIVIGRTDGQLSAPDAATVGTRVFAAQFGALKVTSFVSAKPMQVNRGEVVQLVFEYIPESLATVIPSVQFNGLVCSSVSWISRNALSAQIPIELSGVGPYDMWVSFNSIPYKPRVKVPGILALQLQLVSVHPVNGSTEGFNITLITSDIGIVQQDEVNVSVGGISCFNTNQLNSTAFSCTVPPATGKNKLVVINIGSNATSSELVYIHYNPPVITDISPPSSPTTGGRMIYISGTGFGRCTTGSAPCDATAHNIAVLIAGNPCYLPKLYSDSSVSCITPELFGRNLPLQMQVNGQTASTTSFSYDLPRISTISPQWLLSSNPTMYIEGANFGPLNANRSVLFHDHKKTETFVCPTVTWLAHSSLKCEFTNVSLPLYARFNVTVSVGGYRNPDSNMAEFRTGFLNVAPVVPTLQAVMQEDEELLLELYSYDPDAGDTVQVFVALNPQWGTLFQVTQSNGKGSLINASLASVPVVHSQSKILYIPPENYFGNDSFQVFAIDDKGSQSLTQTIDIIVDAVQDPPVPRSAVINLDEDTTAVIEFKVDDPDQNTTDNITITILAIPQYGSLSIQNGSGNSSNWVEVLNTPFVLPLNVTSAIFRPVNDTNGSPYGTVVFKAQDRYVESIINGTVVINVRAVNDPPVFNRASLNSSVYEDTPTTFVFNVTDADQHDLLVVKVHNLSINGSLYAVSQDLRDSDIIKSSSPLGEGSEIKGPPYKILFSPLKNVFNPIDSTPQRFDISISDRSITLFERILFSIAPVNDVPQLSCGNPTIVELSTDFITNITASVDVRIDATDVDDSGLLYHLVGVPTKGRLIADLRADPLDLGDTFVSPNMKYYFDSQGGVYPFANFTVVAEDSHNSSSSNCTYVFSFKCPPGLVNNAFSRTGPLCTECPEGAVCSQDGSQSPYAKFGWWRSEDNNTFLPCFPMNACPGNELISCSVGYEGTRCGRCSPGYYRFNDGCRRCGEQSGSIQLVIVCCILTIIAFVFFFILKISRQKRGATFGLISIVVNFIQTILLLRQMRLNWPEPLLHLFSWLAFINLNVELASPECLVAEQSFNFSFKMKLSLAIPLIALALALFMPVINHVVNLFKGSTADFERRNSQTSVRTIRAYMSVLSLLFVHVATNSLALFDCTLEADGFSYLDADPSLRCYESWYYQDLPYGYAGLGLYVLGIPFMNLIISYASLLARPNPARANSVGQKFQLFCVKLMSSGHEFKSDYQFISVVQLFQKLSMVVVNIFFTRYIGFQIIITLFFLFSSVLIVFHYRPYEFPILNKFDILSNAASMVVLGLGLTFHFDRLSNSVHGLVVIICIIMVICGFILWAIVAIVWESVSSLELVARLSAYRKSNASTRKADVTGLEVAKSSKALLL